MALQRMVSQSSQSCPAQGQAAAVLSLSPCVLGQSGQQPVLRMARQHLLLSGCTMQIGPRGCCSAHAVQERVRVSLMAWSPPVPALPCPALLQWQHGAPLNEPPATGG